MKVPDIQHPTDTESAPEQIFTPSTPKWVFVLLIGLGLFMIGLVWWFGVLARPALDATPLSHAVATRQWQAFGPSARMLIPTPTPSPTSLVAASPVSASQSISEATVPLPTVTPTPLGQTADPRTAEISGFTTLRLELSNASFSSSGVPMRFSIDPRTYTLDQDGALVGDTWCLQMGVHHALFDLGLSLDPANQDLQIDGAISLHSGFCDNPGPALDEIPVKVVVPADAAARIAYSLRGEQKLSDVADLLSADVAVTVELVLTNPRTD